MRTLHTERASAHLSTEPSLPPSVSWLPAILLVVLVTAGELEYRTRDATAAIAGQIDTAVVIELLATLAVGAVLFLGAVAPRGRTIPAPLGGLWALVIVLTLSAFWAPSATLSFVRAGQLMSPQDSPQHSLDGRVDLILPLSRTDTSWPSPLTLPWVWSGQCRPTIRSRVASTGR